MCRVDLKANYPREREEWILAARIAAMLTVFDIQRDLFTRDCWLRMGRQDAHR